MIDLMAIAPGQVVRLRSGADAHVVENIGDGMWLKARFADGEEDLVFCEDILGLATNEAA